MASSSSLPRTWKYRVFTSFHGPDVRKTLLSHLRKQFRFNGISMFDDEGIERSQTIAPALTQAIKESRISIVVLSKDYASSSWCLDELVEIFKCKEDLEQIVMTVFYGVDPSHVRKQTGDFGRVFEKTCACKTEDERRKWSKALTDAGNIAGEDFFNWDNEARMIEKIAKDVLYKLNANAPSGDFDGMVGLESHLRQIESLLDVNYAGVKMVAISGPAGIGKTTIARALRSRLSRSFGNTCFMKNLKGSYRNGLDEYGLKLRLQKKLLSKILNQKEMKINHLGAVPEMLCDQKVLIILDDVDDMKQLQALVNKTTWFGPGSRIIITTEDQELLDNHGIKNRYHVDFPTQLEASQILCKYAFGQSFAPYGFEKLVKRVTELSSNLPLGLRVIGSILHGKKKDDWGDILSRLERSLDRDIEGVLRVGYDNLQEDDQFLFLLIAFFCNYKDKDHVKALVDDCNMDVGLGLKTLANKSLIQISTEGKILMHKLLQQVGGKVAQRHPKKRKILSHNDDICDALENDSGSGSVIGIALDISTLSSDVHISSRAFKRMRKLRYLNFYTTRFDRENRVHVPRDMNFQSPLRLLHWDKYPRKCLPPIFRLGFLVELRLENTELEKLWDGNQPLKNLKKMSLEHSIHLKELPDLSNATNLESLSLDYCFSLVDIPSSFGNLKKLKSWTMDFCIKLQVIPTHINLTSLESVHMVGCCQLRIFPDSFKNITELNVTDTMLQYLPESIRLSPRLQSLCIFSDRIESFSDSFVKRQMEIDWIKEALDKRASDIEDDVDVVIEKLPYWIKDLHRLEHLCIFVCPKVPSLLWLFLSSLLAGNGESLETLEPLPSESAVTRLFFDNCLKLGEEARRVITRQSLVCIVHGRNVPAEFEHRAVGNSLTIPSGKVWGFYCVVVSPKQGMKVSTDLLLRLSGNGFPGEETTTVLKLFKIETEHIYIGTVKLPDKSEGDVLLEFSTTSNDIDVIKCGFHSMIKTSLMDGRLVDGIRFDETSGFDGISWFDWFCELEDDDENLSGSDLWEFDEPRVKRLKTREFLADLVRSEVVAPFFGSDLDLFGLDLHVEDKQMYLGYL